MIYSLEHNVNLPSEAGAFKTFCYEYLSAIKDWIEKKKRKKEKGLAS